MKEDIRREEELKKTKATAMTDKVEERTTENKKANLIKEKEKKEMEELAEGINKRISKIETICAEEIPTIKTELDKRIKEVDGLKKKIKKIKDKFTEYTTKIEKVETRIDNFTGSMKEVKANLTKFTEKTETKELEDRLDMRLSKLEKIRADELQLNKLLKELSPEQMMIFKIVHDSKASDIKQIRNALEDIGISLSITQLTYCIDKLVSISVISKKKIGTKYYYYYK